MNRRLIDVLNDQEKEVTLQICAARDSLDRVTEAFAKSTAEHELVCKGIIRDKKAAAALAQELIDLDERLTQRKNRMNPDAAEEAYRVLKPNRYDVELIQVRHQRNDTLTYYVKMWWGNRYRVIYESNDETMARSVAIKITDLTGRENFVHREVDSKKDI